MILTPTPKPKKKSSFVCERTIQRRNLFLKNQIKTSSGGATAFQTGELLKTLSKVERMEILKKGGIDSPHIDAEKLVAMKSDLGLSWEKMKTMARYL